MAYKRANFIDINIIISIFKCFVFPGNLKNCSKKKHMMLLFTGYLFSLVINLGFLYNFSNLIRVGMKNGIGRQPWMISLNMSVLSISLWYATCFRQKAFLDVIQHFKKIELVGVTPRKIGNIIISTVLLQSLIPMAYSLVIANALLIKNAKKSSYRFWLMDYDMDAFPLAQNIAIFLFCLLFHVQIFIFPSVLSTVYCASTWNASVLILNLTVSIDEDLKSIVTILEKRRQLKALVAQLEKIISFPMFLLICYHLVDFFYTLTAIVDFDEISTRAAMLEGSLAFLMSFPSYVGIVLCSAKLTNSFEILQKNLREIYQNRLKNLSSNNNTKYVMMLLKSVVDEEVFCLTAWGIVKLRKSVILTSIGALITYGVLIRQTKN